MLADSNILIYSINRSSPKHKKAQKFLENNVNNLEVAHQNIFETIRVLTHPKFPEPMEIDQAWDATLNILNGCRIISPNYLTYQIALELIKKYKLASNKIFDAYLAATALANGIDTIATDNTKDFQKIKEIKTVNPFIVSVYSKKSAAPKKPPMF